MTFWRRSGSPRRACRTSCRCCFFGTALGLSLAPATTSAAFFPHFEHRSRSASPFSVTLQPTRRAWLPARSHRTRRSHTLAKDENPQPAAPGQGALAPVSIVTKHIAPATHQNADPSAGGRPTSDRGREKPHPEDLPYHSKIIPPRSKSILTVTCPFRAPYSWKRRRTCHDRYSLHGVHADRRHSGAHSPASRGPGARAPGA